MPAALSHSATSPATGLTTTPVAGSSPPGDPDFHALAANDVLDRLDVDPATGLADAEAARRLRLYGPNLMRVKKPVSAWRILINQFESAVVLLLAAAAVLSAAFGEWPQAIAVAIVLAINSAIGFFTEIRAVRSMEALRQLGAREARIRRGGTARIMPAGRLVPGDIVLLDGGDLVPADLRIVSAANLVIIAKHVAINAFLAIGMTFVIITGGIDLSVGSVVGLAGMVAGGLILYGIDLGIGYTLKYSV